MKSGPNFLGIECGGTRTIALLADDAGKPVHRLEAGPANLRLLSLGQLQDHFRAIAGQFPEPAALAIGMAGVREAEDRDKVLAAAAQAWPGTPCQAANDLETAFAAAAEASAATPAARIIIISGTGSCCYGRDAKGRALKVGGWGHVLGDQGSGYDIGLGALRAVVRHYDQTGQWPALGARLLRILGLREPNHLVDWAQRATKPEIAALAVEVLAAWVRGDKLSAGEAAKAADILARDATTCATRLARRGASVEFVFTGSVLLKHCKFAQMVARRLRRSWPGATVVPLSREGVWGAVALARELWQKTAVGATDRPGRARTPSSTQPIPPAASTLVPEMAGLSPTEARNPRSLNLDKLPLETAIELMLSEESRVPPALRKQRDQIARAVRLIIRAFRQGGRLFYAGAGTSGRLGALDASECPPTFHTTADRVQAVMAGGDQALSTSAEGAEDDAEAGARALQLRGVSKQDVVVGIAASGRTPFVWGALRAASQAGAKTILLCANPHLRIQRRLRPNLVIAFDVGPEVLTGSSRLKAGTATKLVLNILTTLSMVRLGKVVSNLMAELRPSNAKLRDRAVRIVQELTGAPPPAAERALIRSGWEIKTAVRRLRSRPRAAK